MLKEIKGIGLYLLLIVIAISIPFLFEISPLGTGFSNYIQNNCEPETHMCGLFEISLLSFGLKLLQSLFIIFITLFFIKKTDSVILKSFFNQIKLPVLLFVLFFVIDIALNIYVPIYQSARPFFSHLPSFDISNYNFYYSLSGNYLIVLLIIFIKNIKPIKNTSKN